MIILENLNSEKGKKEGPFRLFNITFVAKYQKNARGTFLGHLKNFGKRSHKAKMGKSHRRKQCKGGLFSLVLFYMLR